MIQSDYEEKKQNWYTILYCLIAFISVVIILKLQEW